MTRADRYRRSDPVGPAMASRATRSGVCFGCQRRYPDPARGAFGPRGSSRREIRSRNSTLADRIDLEGLFEHRSAAAPAGGRIVDRRSRRPSPAMGHTTEPWGHPSPPDDSYRWPARRQRVDARLPARIGDARRRGKAPTTWQPFLVLQSGIRTARRRHRGHRGPPPRVGA